MVSLTLHCKINFFFLCKLDVGVTSFLEPNLFLTGFQNVIIYHPRDKRQALGKYLQRISTELIVKPLIYLFSNVFVIVLV